MSEVKEDFFEQASIEIVRHTQIFEDEIHTETVQKLINELNNYISIDLYFSTPGGALCAMEALIHYLNSRKNEITIYLTDEICSAGTYLLTDFEGTIHLSKNLDMILFHTADRMTSNTRKGEINKKELLKQLRYTNLNDAIKFKALGLTDREIKRYTSGYDVILYRKDFHRLKINSNG
jgi:ATP-dependent protease ClpP protease subunit